MRVNTPEVNIIESGSGVAIEFAGRRLVVELGASIVVDGAWRSSFDGTLTAGAMNQVTGNDPLGDFRSHSLTLSDQSGPLVRQDVKVYPACSIVLVETTALRDLAGASTTDSYFNTTFNSPVMRLADDLSCLTYTWGLTGGETVRTGGAFSDVALAESMAGLPEQLRIADFSPTVDIHQSAEKPFAPFIAFDSQERTLVASPLNHFLVSPMRLIETPQGPAVARGLHGAVDRIPAGTVTLTALVLGEGLVETTLKWGRLLAEVQRHGSPKKTNGPELDHLGFWNCYGGYYAQLFRPTTTEMLRELARAYADDDVPLRYLSLDLWYDYETVGFARRYQPDPNKYPDGLETTYRELGLPYLFHMSAFDRANDYLDTYEFQVEEGSAFPKNSEVYRDLARDFRSWGAASVWHDFLRTQLQHCHSLRAEIGTADEYFAGMVEAMAGESLDVMMCMPTIGHYLASTAHDNVVAVRTSADYVNHQTSQVEMLAKVNDEYRLSFSRQRNRRQNLFLSFLAGALGLAPSHDVFITNREHPEGFADPYATQEALARALSAGIVGIGDKAGHSDKEIVGRLAFPDGSLAQPDHPQYPLAETIHSQVPAFFTETTVGGHIWKYLTLWNLSEAEQEYSVDISRLLSNDVVLYDYFGGSLVDGPVVQGILEPGLARYLILVPPTGGLHLLGFPEKYVTVPRKQVTAVEPGSGSVSLRLELPEGKAYTVATIGDAPAEAAGSGLDILKVERRGILNCVDFRVNSSACGLELRL